MSMEPRKICVVTGSRADYGLLYCLLCEIKRSRELRLQVVATGMHLSPEFGNTYQQIEADGFKIDERVENLLSSDSAVGVAKSIGLGVIGFADAFGRQKPDWVLLLGDRFEILAAAQAALVLKIPVAHLFGGDVTEGAFDEMIRHCITKMSHLHFVTNSASARRVRQLGEDPKTIFNVGSPGLDYIKQVKLLDGDELESRLEFKLRKRNLLVTFHPSTLESASAGVQFKELLAALDRFGPETGILFTKSNADTEGRSLSALVDDFVSSHRNSKAFTSLGQQLYLSTVRAMDAVVGNSSSGLYEVPSFKKPTVNIGDRQKGRLRATSVIDCPVQADAIFESIRAALALDCSGVKNPYGDGMSAKRIVRELIRSSNLNMVTKKRFFDLSFTE